MDITVFRERVADNMFFRIKKNACVVVFFWSLVLSAVVFFFIPFNDIFWQLVSPVLLSAAVCGASAVHFSTVRIEIRQRELYFKRGFLMLQQKRIPIRFISGLHFLQTPLQRLLGQCTLIIFTSGSFSVFIGLDRDDAAVMYQQLLNGGMER